MAIINKLSALQLEKIIEGIDANSPVKLDRAVRDAVRLAGHYEGDEDSADFNSAAGRGCFEMYRLLMYGRKPNQKKAELMVIKALGYFLKAQSGESAEGFLGVLDVALEAGNSELEHKEELMTVVAENVQKREDLYTKCLETTRPEIGDKQFFAYRGLIHSLCGRIKESKECYDQALA